MENEDSNQSAQISVIKYDQNEKKVFISFKNYYRNRILDWLTMDSILFKVMLQKENKRLFMTTMTKWVIKMIKSQISTTTRVAQILSSSPSNLCKIHSSNATSDSLPKQQKHSWRNKNRSRKSIRLLKILVALNGVSLKTPNTTLISSWTPHCFGSTLATHTSLSLDS